MSEYVVIGATGNIGSVVVRELLKQGKAVRAVSRDAARLKDLEEMGAEVWVGSYEDPDALLGAFAGARAAFTMVRTVRDDTSRYRKVGETLARAAAQAKLQHIVNLSSIGADLAVDSGHLRDFYELEHAFEPVTRASIIHLRAGFFMDNFLRSIQEIRASQRITGMLRADLPMPMIWTGDIGATAASWLQEKPETGVHVRELLGQRDVTMAEAANAIGRSIGTPALSYVQSRYDPPLNAEEAHYVETGIENDVVKHRIATYRAYNSRAARAHEVRSAANTTPTSIETFAEKILRPAYEKAV